MFGFLTFLLRHPCIVKDAPPVVPLPWTSFCRPSSFAASKAWVYSHSTAKAATNLRLPLEAPSSNRQIFSFCSSACRAANEERKTSPAPSRPSPNVPNATSASAPLPPPPAALPSWQSQQNIHFPFFTLTLPSYFSRLLLHPYESEAGSLSPLLSPARCSLFLSTERPSGRPSHPPSLTSTSPPLVCSHFVSHKSRGRGEQDEKSPQNRPFAPLPGCKKNYGLRGTLEAPGKRRVWCVIEIWGDEGKERGAQTRADAKTLLRLVCERAKLKKEWGEVEICWKSQFSPPQPSSSRQQLLPHAKKVDKF